MKYQERTYRNKLSTKNLVSFQIAVGETDLYISAGKDLTEIARESVHKNRRFIEEYIKNRPIFLDSLVPIEPDETAPVIIKEMLNAARLAGVGPMASVAGAIAQYVGTDLLEHSDDIIVENGGDIFLRSKSEITVGIFAAESPMSNKVALRIRPEDTPIGICTSSGSVGHSLSLGRADAVCVTSKSASLADAAATSIGNRVRKEGDIKKALDFGSKIEGVLGTLIIVGDKLGAYGAIELQVL